MLDLERIHRFCIKIIQHFPKQARTDKVLSMLGMYTMQGYIDKAKLMFFGRLCHTSNETLSKKVFLIRLCSHFYKCVEKQLGYIQDLCFILHKYDLFEFVKTFMVDGIFPVKKPWKRIVDSAIAKIEQDGYITRIENDEDCVYFKALNPCIYEPSRIWDIA